MTDSALRDPAHRLERRCDGCGQFDFDPHVHHGLPDGTWWSGHHDCCAARGCPDGDQTCVAILEHAAGKRGAELVAHLTGESA